MSQNDEDTGGNSGVDEPPPSLIDNNGTSGRAEAKSTSTSAPAG